MGKPAATDASSTCLLRVQDYDLNATLDSGQAFGWVQTGRQWTGVIDRHWVQLQQTGEGIQARTTSPQQDWSWLTDYLQTDFKLSTALATFPPDKGLQQSVKKHRGLRILRQDPWVCLASFILSSTKQIIQIQQVYHLLSQRLGTAVATPADQTPAHSFPSPEALVEAGETGLRNCRMGFRAKYLYKTALAVSQGLLDLPKLRTLPLADARSTLTNLPGVGIKIANCVLLFSADQPQAFPVDVWIARALREQYFSGKSIPLNQLQAFAEDYFGPHAGLAQQYLFHQARLAGRKRTQPKST